MHVLELRGFSNDMRMFLTHFFKLSGNLLLECNHVGVNAGVDSAIHYL